MCRVLYLILWLYLPRIVCQILWDEFNPNNPMNKAHYLYFADRKRVSESLYILIKVQVLLYAEPRFKGLHSAHLWRNTCYEIQQSQYLSVERYWGHRAVSRAAACFRSWAPNNWAMFHSLEWGWSHVCNLGPLTAPHLLLCAGHFVWHILQRQM